MPEKREPKSGQKAPALASFIGKVSREPLTSVSSLMFQSVMSDTSEMLPRLPSVVMVPEKPYGESSNHGESDTKV